MDTFLFVNSFMFTIVCLYFQYIFLLQPRKKNQMMFLKAMQNIRFVARSTSLCSVLTTEKSLCAIKPVQTVLKRNASIHTRHFLIQKAKLEHIDNFGVFLLVCPTLIHLLFFF